MPLRPWLLLGLCLLAGAACRPLPAPVAEVPPARLVYVGHIGEAGPEARAALLRALREAGLTVATLRQGQIVTTPSVLPPHPDDAPGTRRTLELTFLLQPDGPQVRLDVVAREHVSTPGVAKAWEIVLPEQHPAVAAVLRRLAAVGFAGVQGPSQPPHE